MLATLILLRHRPLVSKQREHIVIDTFDFLMSRVKRGFDIFADIGLFAHALRASAIHLPARDPRGGVMHTTNVLKIPLAPVALRDGGDRHHATR